MDRLLLWLGYVVPLTLISLLSVMILRSVAPELYQVQLLYFVLGFGLFYLVSRIDYHIYSASPWIWYGLTLFFLGITLLFGQTIRGSTRWLGIGGLSLQTTELIKPLLILFIATFLTDYYPKTIRTIFAYGGSYLVPVMLVFVQPDFGTALLLLSLFLASLIAVGMRGVYLLGLGVIFIVLMPLVFFQLKPYQQDRLISFVQPYEDPLGAGYNALQSTIAVGSGKLFGRGLGQGTQSHLRFLPERHSDFIFASLVEELGMVGGLLLLALYGMLAYSLILTARKASTDSGSTIVLMSLTLVLVQVLVNVGMNMGILPITGLTLPLVSAGGSSILSFFVLLGICYSVARFHVPLRSADSTLGYI